MEQTTKLIAACASLISTLVWPGIFIATVLLFRSHLVELMASAKSRRFTLKIGGQELTMEEANQQQRTLIADLQKQLVDLRKRMDGPNPSSGASASSSESSGKPRGFEPPSILWVDDEPKTNSYLIEELTSSGVQVTTAASTAEALRVFQPGRFGVVITDMARNEGGKFRGMAGIKLIEAIRKLDAKVPIYVYSGSGGEQNVINAARKAGATAVTSSPTVLAGLLNMDELSTGG